MTRRLLISCVVMAATVYGSASARQAPYRTHNDRFSAPRLSTLDAWKRRAEYVRGHVLASAGLLPLPEKTPLRPSVFGEVRRAGYLVSKVYFESLPGFFVTGNLYRPIGDGPFPAVLSPHGHWTYGRLENTPTNSGPARAIGLARQGFVVFSYDMVGYNDSQQLPHTFGDRRAHLWGLSLAGLQLWNGIRALDFLETLPYVRREALAATGESGGGTQTFLLAAADSRVKVAVPVNMISLHMQGGCLCENPPGLRLDMTNVEIAATIAPRPMLMVSATGDWTAETMEVEYPAVRAVYELFGAADRVQAVRMTAEHNYNKDSREAMYAWMARWLQQAPPDVRLSERAFTVEPLSDLLVFYQRPLPPEAVTAPQLTDAWIAAARRQLGATPSPDAAAALRHALGPGIENEPNAATSVEAPAFNRTVLVAHADPAVGKALSSAGFAVRPIAFTPVDEGAASKVQHFDTYNRTAAGQRVADIVAAVRANPGAALVADGDAALAALLASAVSPVPVAVLDVGRFDTSSDTAYLDRLYIPGLRRAGDLQTAASLARGRVLVHNAGDRFAVSGVESQARQLTPAEIAITLGQASSAPRRKAS
jgi:dienelactone hydrolase